MTIEIWAAAVAMGAALIGAVWGYLSWRSKLTTEVRQVAIAMRERLDTVEGTFKLGGSAEANKHLERELGDLLPRLNDRQLRRACDDLHKAWLRLLAYRPLAHLGHNGAPVAADIVVQEHVGAARQAIRAVVERANALERPLPARG